MSKELLKECAERLDALYGVENELSSRIKAELAKPEPEPFGYISDTMKESVLNGSSYDFVNMSQQRLSPWDFPVYTHPPARQKPLSDGEIKQLWEESLLNTNSFTRKFARSIEKAHGITS